MTFPPVYIKSESPYVLTYLKTPSPLPDSTPLLIKLVGLLNNYPPSNPEIINLIEQCRRASNSSTSIPYPASTEVGPPDSKKTRTMSLLDKVISGSPPSSVEARSTATLDIPHDVSLHDLSSLLLTAPSIYKPLVNFILNLHVNICSLDRSRISSQWSEFKNHSTFYNQPSLVSTWSKVLNSEIKSNSPSNIISQLQMPLPLESSIDVHPSLPPFYQPGVLIHSKFDVNLSLKATKNNITSGFDVNVVDCTDKDEERIVGKAENVSFGYLGSTDVHLWCVGFPTSGPKTLTFKITDKNGITLPVINPPFKLTCKQQSNLGNKNNGKCEECGGEGDGLLYCCDGCVGSWCKNCVKEVPGEGGWRCEKCML
ncbi:hypothetical protein TrST_g936 [Triparma strigata]|uniref:Uncharacterized protein n=1 Tax=Triparma strigata TaxID=1606541 RepID=A0A9W7F1W0_9STRA|nr:hypothetical protein TrST_g936 [Triparma strigata]